MSLSPGRTVTVLVSVLLLTVFWASPVDGQRRGDDDLYEGAASLAFVFDITGSMYNDLVQVIKGAAKILATTRALREKPLYNYVLVPFHDPEVGPILSTRDHYRFLNELQDLYVQGGGDCPEMSVSAIKEAIDVSLPNSFIYVFTDARSKDFYLTDEVLALIQRKQSQVVFVLTGDCGEPTHKGYRAYEQIASTSSGQVFKLQKSQVNEVLNFVEVAVRSRKVNLMSVDIPVASQNEFNISIDSKLQEVTFSVSGQDPRITLIDPAGNKVTKKDGLNILLDISKALVVNLEKPMPGTWKLIVESDDKHTIRATGLSTLNFVTGFSRYPVDSIAETDHRPIGSIPTHMIINVTEPLIPPAGFTLVEIIDLQGKVLGEHPVIPDAKLPNVYRVPPFIPPNKFFYIKLTGVDERFYSIQRLTPTAITRVIPGKPNVYMPEISNGYFGLTAVLVCQVESLVPVSVRWYKTDVLLGPDQKYEGSVNATHEIPGANQFSEGMYFCEAENSVGKSKVPTFLDISEPPPSITVPKNVSVLPGEDAMLTCNVFSTVSFNVSWYSEGYRGKLRNSPKFTDFNNGSLLIRKVHRGDEGKYTCVASNEGGYSEQDAYVRVQVKPIATVTPEESLFVTGSTHDLVCTATGFPEPEIHWLRGGTKLESDANIQIKDNKLTLLNMQRGDQGQYECLAANPAGEDTRTASLLYIEEPKITLYKSKVLVASGDDAVLLCAADGIPAPEIKWYKGDIELKELSYVQITLDGQLKILETQDLDAGEYTCKAVNDAGEDSVDIVLEVGAEPSFIQTPENIGADIGTTAQLDCQSEGLPEPTQFWKRDDGHNLVLGNRIYATQTGSLVLEDISLGDEGNYVCVAENQFGIATASAYLTITGIVRPLIGYMDPFIQARQGESVSLNCQAMLGNPPPTIYWVNNGRVLQEDQYIVKNGEGNVVIDDVQDFHAGDYTCVASNVGGNASFIVSLEVQVPPVFVFNYSDPDAMKTDFVVVEGEGVVLPCNVEGDPRPEITWFKDESPISLTDFRYFTGDDGSLEIFSAEAVDSGRYRCQASNEAGEVDRTLDLFVQVPPTIAGDQEEEYVVNVNETVVLPCEVSGNPKPEVTWRKKFVAFDPTSEGFLVGDHGMTIHSARIEDKAIYECIVQNEAGHTSKVFALIVQIPPKLTRGTDEDIQTVQKGDEVILDCENTGDPEPVVEWYKEEALLSVFDLEDNMSLEGTGSLYISSALVSDSGAYFCKVENPAGTLTKDFTLHVLDPPSLPANLSVYTDVPERNPIILTCPATGTPVPLITWYKNGQLITGDQLGLIILEDGSLEILDTRGEDSAKYKCVAENDAGKVDHEIELKVLVPPKLTGKDSGNPGVIDNPDVIVTNNISLTCPVEADPVPTITWFKDNIELDLSILDPRYSVSADGKVLTITISEVPDTARYICKAENVAGQVEKSFDLDVHVPPEVDENSASPDNTTVVIAHGLHLDCPVKGIPRPKVIWMKDGEVIFPDLDPNINLVPGGRRLEILGARVTDTGQYTCVGENVAGTTEKNFNVSVLVPPKIDKPAEINKPEVVRDRSLILKCPVSGIPLPTITWYKGNLKITDDMPEFTLEDMGWTLKINAAQEHDSTRFTCRAENPAGKGEKAFDVSVFVPPSINKAGVDDKPSVIVNQSTIINCPVEGKPTPQITWFKNDVRLDATIQSRYEILAGGRQLRVKYAQLEDTAQYKCEAANKAGTDSATFDLEVQVPTNIRLTNTDKNPKVIVGGTVKLSCPATGVPPPEITWQKNGIEITDGDIPNVSIQQGGKELIITGALEADTAQYTCTAVNIAGEKDVTYKLDVQVPPSIDPNEVDLTPHVEIGNSVTLNCPAEGTPIPDIIWLKDGQPIDYKKNIHYTLEDDGRRLTVERSVVEDAGTFTCLAANAAGNAEQEFELDVWVKPNINSPKDELYPTVIKEHTAALYCPAEGNPPPFIMWLKNGDPVQLDDRVYMEEDGRELRIKNATESDTARYQCVARNDAGQDSIIFNLEVHVPPSIDESNVVYQRVVLENRTIIIECPVSGIPKPTVTWKINKQPLVLRQGLSLTNNDYHLKLDSAQVSDTAIYYCVASNLAGELTKKFGLEVQVPPRIDVSQVATDMVITQNQTATIHCPVTGIPVPLILWFKNDYVLRDWPYPDLSLSSDRMTLDVVNAQVDDSGEYRCEATSPSGLAYQKYTVEVQVPPKIVDSASTTILSVVKGNSLTLPCIASGLPIPDLAWMKNKVTIETSENPQLVFGEDGESLEIVNAKPSDSGTYDCHAENSAGVQVRTFVVEVQVPPSVTLRGTQKSWVVMGDSLTIECPVTGTPQPIITWIRQGREILQFGSQNLKLHNKGQRLEIVDAQLVDVGQYECVPKNEAGEARLMHEVSIYIPPTIEDGPTKEEAEVRNPATLYCESLGLPDPEVTWEKDGHVFPTKGLRHTMRNSGTIDFTSLQLEDAGLYRCTAKNEAGTVTREIELEVQVPPTLIGKQPLTVESVSNERVVLPCKVKGTPTPTIIWQKGAKVISGGDGFDILGDGSILIPKVKRKNSGVYICIARNNAGTAFGRVRLRVLEPPVINVRETEFIIKSSDNIVLPCRAYGRPRPKISWLKNGQPIARSSAYVRLLRSGLGFPYVRKEDTGVYTCIAKNKAGTISEDITLQVQVAPQITVAQRVITFTLGDDATIDCEATGIPPPTVEWLKAGRLIVTDSRKFQISSNGNLEIRSVTQEDTGSYTCVAKNVAGRTSQERLVRVQVPPSFTVVPYNQEVTLNSRLKLRCTANGIPTPNVHWMKDGLPIETPPSVVGRSVLVIRSVRQDDTGRYTCLAQNPAGEASAEAFISVKIPPEILTPPNNKAVVVAERVVLPCKVGGDPQPEVVWMKNGRQVQLSERIQQLSNGSLVIYRSTTSDAGEYKCMATNDFGTSEGVAMLTIREPPSFEIEPVDTIVDEGENVLIDCVGSGEPVPIMEWMVGWDVLENKGRLSILPNNSLSIVAAQLSDSMTYRCLASNNLGKSFIEVNLTVVVHGEWSDWSGWEPCSSTCGEGRQLRHRSCDEPEPANQGRHCPGLQTESRACVTRRCPVYNWGSWSHWSACTRSCGSGVRTRQRQCDNAPPASGGIFCIGPGEQRDYCNSEPCPVHGGWSSWNDFGECSASCEGGLRRRFRSCSNPQPSNGGRECTGTGVDTQTCNQIQCPVDGRWSEWSDWSACSNSCDQGTKQRTRMCRQPMHRGQPCIGDEVQKADCFIQKCYDFPIRAEGNLIGYVNNIQIPEGTFTANMLPRPDNSATNVNATINNIPPTLVPHFRHLVSILTPVYWSTALEVDGATNGYRLTNGEFAREVQVQYATGEILKMSQYSKGVDKNGKLQMDIVVRGSVPEFNETEVVEVSPYWEQYLQTGLGTLHAQSTRLFYVDDNIVPYAWNHSITYSNNQVRMPYLVQRLYARNIQVIASPERESINFIVDTSILPGAPSNQCPSGFLLSQDGIYCEDEDECAVLNPCSDYCHNSQGGFSCSCPIGFALDRDGRQCVDLDECLTGFVSCDRGQQCMNTIGSYKCEMQCSRGYRPSEDGQHCIDIDECTERPNMCDQICVNKFGGFRCSCLPGYRRVSRGRASRGRCEDIDECELSSPPCEQVCANAEGNYLCSCRQGYELVSGGRCRDINECTLGRHDCSPLENCVNTLGSFNCVTLCPKGAHIVNGRCTDIDECSTGKHRCYYNQRCVNSDPGYRCLCDTGYTSAGPGTPCLDLDECEQIPSVCTYKCQNTYGDYECICPPGQVRLADRKSCAGLEFLEPVKVIDTNNIQTRTQSDTHGSYGRYPRAASCSPGLVYSVSQGACIDRDECTEDPGICQHNCTNTFGSYTCSCPPGYRADKAGICHDIDECIELNIKCGADKMCFNTRGEFTCIDIPCPRDHQRDPITNNCVLECIDAEVACPPNAKYADVIEFRTLALPSGVLADKDLILLTAYNQDDVILRKTKFKLLQNDKKVAFKLRVKDGEGIVFTPQPLEDKQLYKIKVKAESYDNEEENIQYQTTFMIHISVSAYKY